MTLRLLAYVECDDCHAHFNQLVSARGLHRDSFLEEVHELVLAAEGDEWECRKNATEHVCARCVEKFHNPF